MLLILVMLFVSLVGDDPGWAAAFFYLAYYWVSAWVLIAVLSLAVAGTRLAVRRLGVETPSSPKSR